MHAKIPLYFQGVYEFTLKMVPIVLVNWQFLKYKMKILNDISVAEAC